MYLYIKKMPTVKEMSICRKLDFLIRLFVYKANDSQMMPLTATLSECFDFRNTFVQKAHKVWANCNKLMCFNYGKTKKKSFADSRGYAVSNWRFRTGKRFGRYQRGYPNGNFLFRSRNPAYLRHRCRRGTDRRG